MATINLGAIKFNWKGAYNSGTSYAVDDVVSSGGNSYVCIQAHSNQAVGNATAYWNIMSSAGTNGTNGTNGTDVGTVITAQGDILYRDGSGLQRLPKGTANQVLKMNSGATAPEYGTLSSDCVKIASGDFPTNANELNIDNVFTLGTYNIYKVYFSNMNFSSGNNNMGVRMIKSDGNNHTASEYSYIQTDQYRESGANNGTNPAGQWNETSWLFNNWNWADDTASSKRSGGELTLFNPMESGVCALMTYHIIQWEQAGNYFLNFAGTGTINSSTTQFRGISFRSVGNHNFGGGTYAVYGFKQ